MAFRTNAAPYQRAKKSTLSIMLILLAALLVVWVFGIVYSFKLQGEVNAFVGAFNDKWASQIENGKKEALVPVLYGLRAILMVVISVAVTAVCDVLTTIARHKKTNKGLLGQEILHDQIHNYSWVTAVIFALTLPVYTPYYVIIIGAIFATVVVKNFFGGFGKNIFNPAIMARIFVGLCFGGQLMVPEILVSGANSTLVDGSFGIDAVTGATLTGAFKNTAGWLATTRPGAGAVIYGSIFADYTLVDMLFGNYVGALGETFTIVILVLGIILAALKVINWRTPVFYLGTVALTALVIALSLGLANPFSYVLYHLSLGGLMFGAVFMLTDPVTGPTSSFGKTLMACLAGLLTVLIRIKGGYPEGVMFSIALCNLLTPTVDALVTGKSNSHLVRKYCFVFGTIAVSLALCTGISFKVNNNGLNDNGGREIYEVNNIDVIQYGVLNDALPLKDGHQYQKIENFTSTNEKIVGLVLDKENNISLEKAYNIVDANGEKIAIAYSVKDSGEIDMEFDVVDHIATALVAINNDGTLYGVGALTPVNSKGFGSESMLNTHANKDFTGKTEANYGEVDGVNGATYSSKLIKKLIGVAYEEFKTNK